MLHIPNEGNQSVVVLCNFISQQLTLFILFRQLDKQHQRAIIMGLKSLLGIVYSSKIELILIFTQLLCYLNAYYATVILLGPLSFLQILAITFLNSRAIAAFYMCNSTHVEVSKDQQHSYYCKKCATYIQNRDHHCVFIGRCVEKNNYAYFLSYVLYSYLLSFTTFLAAFINFNLYLEIMSLRLNIASSLMLALISSLYFVIFTGGLLASSFRSIFLGIYVVEQLKNIKTPRYTNWEIRKMWFSSKGRKLIFSQFSQNWKRMVGEDCSWKQIMLVL